MARNDRSILLDLDSWNLSTLVGAVVGAVKVVVELLEAFTAGGASNRLETASASFLEEEPSTNGDDKVKDTPEQESGPAHVFDHVWGDEGEDEVEEPLAGDSNRDTRLTDAGWEDLRNVWPGQWTPGKVVGDDEQVNQSDGSDAGRADISVRVSWMSLDNRGGSDLTSCHEKRTNDEDLLAVDSLDDEDDKGQTSCDFDGSEDGGEKKIRVSLVANEQLEVLRCVVCAGFVLA